MNYCLKSTELESLLLLKLHNRTIEDKTLKSIIDKADQWQDKLLCLTFSFARILERQRGLSSLNNKMIEKLFSLPDKMFIDIQECDEDFVDYMLRNEYSDKSNLELSLLDIERRLSEHYYGKNTLRD